MQSITTIEKEMTIYIRIPQQKGSVTAKNNQDWIEILHFSFSVDREIYTTPGHVCNRICSDINADEIQIYKTVDKASAYFFSESCTGKAISEIDISIVNAQGMPIIQYKLDNVIISGYELFADEDDTPHETISLNFTDVEVRYSSIEGGVVKPISVKARTGSRASDLVRLHRHIENRSPEGFNLFVATVYGEAAAASEVAWQSIGSVIINRVNNRRFKHGPKHHTVRYCDTDEVIKLTGFDAFTNKNIPYQGALAYMTRKSTAKPVKIDHLINILKPIYFEHKTTTDAELYFSPNEQKREHELDPKHYPEKPRWNYNEITQVHIHNLAANDDFAFFKYIKRK